MNSAVARGSLTVVLSAVLLAGGVTQDKKPPVQKKFALTPEDEIQIPADRGSQRVIDLDLLDALRLADTSNADLSALRLVPLRTMQDVIIARAFYDSEIYAEAGFRSTENPSTSPFLPEIKRDFYDAQAGWRKRFFSGLLADVTYSASQLDQTVTAVSGFPDKLYDTSLNLSLTQPLLRGAGSAYGQADIRRTQATRDGAANTFEQDRQNTLLAVVRAYWELVFARADYKVKFQAKELADRQLEITQARIDVRDLAPRDKVADEAEVAVRKEGLIIAENLIREREDALRALLFSEKTTDMWDWVLRPTSSMEADLSQIAALEWHTVAQAAMTQRPDLASLRNAVLGAQQTLLQADTDLWPQLDLTGSYNTGASRTDSFRNTLDDAGGLDFPDWSLRLQFSYPIGNRAAFAVRDRAQLEVERTERVVFASEIAIRREVRDAVRNLKTLAESIRATQESVRLGQSDWETAVAKERAGTLTKFDVMERNQRWSESRSRLKRNQVDFRIAEAVLDHVQGVLKVPEVEEPKKK